MPGSSGSHNALLPLHEAWHVTILRMPHPSWYLDELAHAGSEHLEANYVARYEVKAGPGAKRARPSTYARNLCLKS